MQLDSGIFFAFLFATWLVWRVSPARIGGHVLLVASLFFYGFSNPVYAVLLLVLLAINHWGNRTLSHPAKHWSRPVTFAGLVLLNVGALLFFKWAAIRWSPHGAGVFSRWISTTSGHVLYPLGLSYIIFQMVACNTDVYRRQFQWNGGLGGFLLFGFFFPQVSSGPIPRARQLFPQLEVQGFSRADLEAALPLIFFGLFKKFVVANRLNIYVQEIFTTELPLSSAPVALGMIFNALQLYADFSGYTDMARGVARLFGITLGENFDRPLLAQSVTDFWRRWHISLSSWLKDYLYMPLVIRLRNLGKAAIVISFLITFVICGLWHKVTWAYVWFGVLHGTALAVEFLTKKGTSQLFRSVPKRLVSTLGWAYACGFFILTNVLFRAEDLPQATKLYKHLLAFSALSNLGELFAYSGPVLFGLNFVVLGCWIALSRMQDRQNARTLPWFVMACALALLFLGKLPEGNFIYAQF